jgi:Domain of unknown function (DUF4129)
LQTDRRLGVLAAVAGLLVLAVLGAATGGHWQLRQRSWLRPDGNAATVAPSPRPDLRTRFPTPPAAPSNAAHLTFGWLRTAGLILLVLAVAAAVLWLWQRYRRSALDSLPDEPLATAGLLEVPPDVPLLRQGVQAAQRSLAEIADPNNAIVAAWLALEEAASSSGVHREPAQTPTEFTVAVLADTAADPQATSDLLHLYHRARFSSAGVGAAEVTQAVNCLAILAASWAEIRTNSWIDKREVTGDAG